jgi:predicted MFS family arabinose efflux permease
MGMANMAISIGNYWQGIVAESLGYAVVLYLDALFALLVILVIPFLREREERSTARPVTAEPLLATG